ncbi:MAG TPA: hypothetical protein VK590_11565 [Saprospiraceae bacterium]|nr:hypothetical protein [Saprospiraceae bacterium]
MSGIIIFIVFHQKKIYKIETEKKLLEKINQLKIAEAVIKSQEDERNSLADELHDEIVPNLAGAVFFLKADTGTDLLKERENKMYAIEIIDQGMKNIRQLSHLLHPGGVDIFGFFKALNNFVNRLNLTEQIDIEINIREKLIPLNEFYQLALYRVVQELIVNAIKHSEAKTFKIDYYIENKLILINLMHDGSRFNTEDYLIGLDDSNGIGLMNIQNRIQLLNGKINFDYQDEYKQYGILISIPMVQNNSLTNLT